MALAMIYPEPTPGKRTDLLGHLTGGISRERLSLARAVLRAAPEDLAPLVLAGGSERDRPIPGLSVNLLTTDNHRQLC